MSLNVTFPGLGGVRRGSYTATHGMRPGVAVVECVPQAIATIRGTLTLTDGVTSLALTNALITETGVRQSGGRFIQIVYIQDRRWRWQYPAAVGQWNVRLPDGTVDPATAKSARELAGALFDSMGESVNVTALPADEYPFVDWRGEKSWVVCQQLLARYGCDVAPDFFTDTFVVVKLGVGSSLPSGGTEMSVSLGSSFNPWPDTIQIICDRTVWESKFILQAVGLDTDGKIKAIDDLSYAPSEGWAAHGGVNTTGEGDPTNLIPTAGSLAYGLANRTVYRWYQISSLCSGALPGGGTPESIEHCLPLRRKRLLTYASDVEQYEAPPLVEGTFLIGAAPDALENSPTFTECDTPFELDVGLGLVKFNVPLVRVNGSNNQILPATLYLTTSHYVQDATKNFLRYFQFLNIASNGVPTESRLREEFRATLRGVYSGESLSSTVDNSATLEAVLDGELAVWSAGYTAQSSTAVIYANMQAIGLDGKRRAVTWTVDCGDPGAGGATTSATENSECLLGITPRWARYRIARAEPVDTSSASRRRRMRKK